MAAASPLSTSRRLQDAIPDLIVETTLIDDQGFPWMLDSSCWSWIPASANFF